MEQLLKVMKDESNDRYIFIAYDEGNIVGLNFHQGITRMDNNIDYYYAKPCPYTTETFLRMINNTPIYKKSEDEIYEIIKNAVEFVSEVITYTPRLK